MAGKKVKIGQMAAMANNIPILNDGSTECTIGNIHLKLGDTIEYKPSADDTPSMGRIIQFKYAGHLQADTDSVWMNIKDITTRTGSSDWCSVIVWKSYHDRGMFLNNKTELKNDSPKPSNPIQRPF